MSVAFPALLPARVAVSRLHAQAVHRAPTSFIDNGEVLDHGGRAWRITITMQRMNATDAAVLGAWLASLNAMGETFTFNLAPWARGVLTDPDVKTFRLEDPAPAIRGDLSVAFDCTFTAIEDTENDDAA